MKHNFISLLLMFAQMVGTRMQPHDSTLVVVLANDLTHGPQVGFRDQKAVKKVVALKSNEIVNRLNRTKREEFPNLEARREAHDAEVRMHAAAACEVWQDVRA